MDRPFYTAVLEMLSADHRRSEGWRVDMVCRLSFLYASSTTALIVVSTVGLLTALAAAFMGGAGQVAAPGVPSERVAVAANCPGSPAIRRRFEEP